MGEELEAHPPTLRKAGKGLQDVSGRLTNAWQELQNTLHGMGEVFGDDVVSALIQASYEAAHGMAQESYTSAADRMKDFGDGLVVMADVFEKVEHATAEESSKLDKAV